MLVCLRPNNVVAWDLIVILGMKVVLPACSPPKTHTSKTRFVNRVRMARVPLQMPFLGSRFQRIIIGAPFLSWRFDRGMPDTLIVLRHSTGY